jgi:hypothetical protein
MRKLLIIAAAGSLCAFPALAQQREYGSPPPGSEQMHRDLGGMKGDLGERLGEHKTYGYERESDMRRHGDREGDWRYRHAEDMGMGMGMRMREGCKYITVRQRQGDEIIVRHFRRCD